MSPLLLLSCVIGAPVDTGEGTAAPLPVMPGEGDCGDGLDDDGDGLADCEDGDCMEYPSCSEDCTDGADNDSDGLTDCEDDECWGGGCTVAISRVTGGRMNLIYNAYYGNFNFSSAHPFYRWRSTQQVYLTSVTGTVELLSPALSTWVRCSWSLAHGSFSERWILNISERGSSESSTYSAPISRSGFVLGDGCPELGSSVLPSDLSLRSLEVWAGEAPRYYGAATGYQHTYQTYQNESRYSYDDLLYWSTFLYTIGALGEGGTWMVAWP